MAFLFPLFYQTINVEGLGDITVTCSETALIRVETNIHQENKTNAISEKVCQQLEEYFSGSRKSFELEMDFEQGTGFQKKVWKALLDIPYGQTISYKELADRVGSVKGYRAVGLANGKNPIPIIVPCHRVIGSNGKLTGYASGIDVKRFLLETEGFIKQGSLF